MRRFNSRDVLGVSGTYFSAGSFPETDELGIYTGITLRAWDASIEAAWGRELGGGLHAGIGIKGVFRQLHIHSASAQALDLGLLWETPVEGLDLGLSVLNMGTRLTFIRDKERLPETYRAGIAYTGLLDQIRLTADYLQVIDDDPRWAFGAEWSLYDKLVLRGGYRTDEDVMDGWSIGFGFGTRAVSLDYAYAPYGFFGDTHRITMSYRLGVPDEEPVPRVPNEVADVWTLPDGTPSGEVKEEEVPYGGTTESRDNPPRIRIRNIETEDEGGAEEAEDELRRAEGALKGR